MENILIRKAMPKDAKDIAKLYDRVWSGKYPLNDYLNSDFIEEALTNDEDIWFLAHQGDKCVGSSMGLLDQENKRLEFGRTVIIKEFRTRGLARKLSEMVDKEALIQGVDLLWGSIRNGAIYKISQLLNLVPVGYSEFYFVNKREVQLIGLKLSSSGKEKRVASCIEDIYKLEGMQKIMQKIRLNGKKEEYPKEVIAKVSLKGKFTSIELDYYEPNKALIIRSLFEDKKIKSEYLEATVLIDKVDHIKFLQNLGFSITAFLPGWFQKDNKRYDCVLLTNPFVPSEMQDDGLEPILKELVEGFGGY